jgi:hypothetical protein
VDDGVINKDGQRQTSEFELKFENCFGFPGRMSASD